MSSEAKQFMLQGRYFIKMYLVFFLCSFIKVYNVHMNFSLSRFCKSSRYWYLRQIQFFDAIYFAAQQENAAT
jgi:hypothetical protein